MLSLRELPSFVPCILCGGSGSRHPDPWGRLLGQLEGATPLERNRQIRRWEIALGIPHEVPCGGCAGRGGWSD